MGYLKRQLRRPAVQNFVARAFIFGLMWLIYLRFYGSDTQEQPKSVVTTPLPVEDPPKHKLKVVPPKIENDDLNENIIDSPLGKLTFQNGPEEIKYLDLKTAAATALQKTAAHAKTLTLTIADRENLDILYNFLEHTEALEMKPIVICTEAETYDVIEAEKELSFPNAVLFFLPSFDSSADALKPRITRVEAIKYNITLQLMVLGHAVLMTDPDVTWVKNPFAAFVCRACDVEVQKGFYGLSPGVAFYRPTKNSQAMVKEIMQTILQRPQSKDQTIFTEIVQKLTKVKKVNAGTLPEAKFPNGQTWYHQHYLESIPMTDIVCYHNNFVRGKSQKIFRARALGIWSLDTDAYYSNTETKYLQYENPFPNMKGFEERALETAFKIGQMLDRKVILPTFTCPPGKFQCQYKQPGQCFCSLAEILNLDAFESKHRYQYREHLFLQHPKVPESVNTSLSEVMLIENKDIVNIKPLYSLSNRVFRPQNIMTGATSQEIMNWFGVLGNYSVLRFSSLYGAYSLF